jgi:hypothetical protein
MPVGVTGDPYEAAKLRQKEEQERIAKSLGFETVEEAETAGALMPEPPRVPLPEPVSESKAVDLAAGVGSGLLRTLSAVPAFYGGLMEPWVTLGRNPDEFREKYGLDDDAPAMEILTAMPAAMRDAAGKYVNQVSGKSIREGAFEGLPSTTLLPKDFSYRRTAFGRSHPATASILDVGAAFFIDAGLDPLAAGPKGIIKFGELLMRLPPWAWKRAAGLIKKAVKSGRAAGRKTDDLVVETIDAVQKEVAEQTEDLVNGFVPRQPPEEIVPRGTIPEELGAGKKIPVPPVEEQIAARAAAEAADVAKLQKVAAGQERLTPLSAPSEAPKVTPEALPEGWTRQKTATGREYDLPPERSFMDRAMDLAAERPVVEAPLPTIDPKTCVAGDTIQVKGKLFTVFGREGDKLTSMVDDAPVTFGIDEVEQAMRGRLHPILPETHDSLKSLGWSDAQINKHLRNPGNAADEAVRADLYGMSPDEYLGKPGEIPEHIFKAEAEPLVQPTKLPEVEVPRLGASDAVYAQRRAIADDIMATMERRGLEPGTKVRITGKQGEYEIVDIGLQGTEIEPKISVRHVKKKKLMKQRFSEREVFPSAPGYHPPPSPARPSYAGAFSDGLDMEFVRKPSKPMAPGDALAHIDQAAGDIAKLPVTPPRAPSAIGKFHKKGELPPRFFGAGKLGPIQRLNYILRYQVPSYWASRHKQLAPVYETLREREEMLQRGAEYFNTEHNKVYDLLFNEVGRDRTKAQTRYAQLVEYIEPAYSKRAEAEIAQAFAEETPAMQEAVKVFKKISDEALELESQFRGLNKETAIRGYFHHEARNWVAKIKHGDGKTLTYSADTEDALLGMIKDIQRVDPAAAATTPLPVEQFNLSKYYRMDPSQIAPEDARALLKALENYGFTPQEAEAVFRSGPFEQLQDRIFVALRKRRDLLQNYKTTPDVMQRYFRGVVRNTVGREELSRAKRMIEDLRREAGISPEVDKYFSSHVEWLEQRAPESIRSAGLVHQWVVWNALGFYDASAALVNLSQMFTHLAPKLGARYFMRGIKELEGTGKQIFLGKAGTSTNARVLRDLGIHLDTPKTFLSPRTGKVAGKWEYWMRHKPMPASVMYLFNRAEVVDRAVGGLGTYYKAIEGKIPGVPANDYNAAIRAGKNAIDEAFFTYTPADYAPWMRSQGGKVLGLFTSFFLRTSNLMTKWIQKDPKLALGAAAASMAAGGLDSIPLISIYDEILARAADLPKFKDVMRRYINDPEQDPKMVAAAKVIQKGLPTLVGVDVSHRVGIGGDIAFNMGRLGSPLRKSPTLQPFFKAADMMNSPSGAERKKAFTGFMRSLAIPARLRRLGDAYDLAMTGQPEKKSIFSRYPMSEYEPSPTEWDIFVKAMGFQLPDESYLRDAVFTYREEERKRSSIRRQYIEDAYLAELEGGAEGLEEYFALRAEAVRLGRFDDEEEFDKQMKAKRKYAEKTVIEQRFGKKAIERHPELQHLQAELEGSNEAIVEEQLALLGLALQ